MKLFLAIVPILMLLSLSTGVETSDNSASRTVTAALFSPWLWGCSTLGEQCSIHSDCCGDLCCSGVQCSMTYVSCNWGW
uniref:Conotoxin n=1 Tax=Conus andremenezi TaxID=1077466 RepID=A0A291C1R1_9COND|nr:conotoxin [Conus andremenezi]ATF27399.1 conotoxin [Conus andremenezi]